MALKEVELQIKVEANYQTIDLDRDSTFALNYTLNDLTNPTVTKVPYSSQISLPKTKTNNDIFANVGIRSTTDIFDPLSIIDFRLFINNNLFQSGYLELEEVDLEPNGKYKVRLYGELGNFFYYLSGIPLNGLDVIGSYSHAVNITNMNTLLTSDNGRYGYALTYQGEYDSFDSSNTDNGTKVEESTWTSGSTIYQDVTLDENKRNEKAYSGEYRTYYQKPTLKVNNLINSIVQQAAKDGYTIDLDPDFFSTSNPYFNDTWLLCNGYEPGDIPGGQSFIVTQFGDTKGVEGSAVGISENEASTYAGGSVIPTTSYIGQNINIRPAISGSIPLEPGQSIEAVLNLRMVATCYAAAKNERQHQGKRHPMTVNFRVVNASGGGELSTAKTATAANANNAVKSRIFNYNVRAKRNSRPSVKSEYFGIVNFLYDRLEVSDLEPDGKTEWKFKVDYTNNTSSTQNVVLDLNITGNTYWDRQNQNGSNHKRTDKMGVGFEIMEGSSILVRNTSTTSTEDDGRTNTQKDYADMIGSEHTVLDLLLSYCKVFGLFFTVSKEGDKIWIGLRDNYYKQDTGTYEMLDWTSKVDRNRDFKIQPLAFNFQKGVFKYNELGTKYEEAYKGSEDESNKEREGVEYGSFTVNTGYSLGSDEYNYLDGIIFDNIVMATGYSQYFAGRSNAALKDNKEMPYLQDNSGSGVELNGFGLLFRDGTVSLNKPYRITDDTDVMKSAGTICWNNSNNNYRQLSVMPKYCRTIQKSGEVYSLNFGTPGKTYGDSEDIQTLNSGIYPRYWRSYIQDRLDANCKILTCYILLKPTDLQGDLLSKFIYIDNAIWVINQISNFNPLSNAPTKVELIKVKDINNYLDHSNLTDSFILTYNGSQIFSNIDGNQPQTITIGQTVTEFNIGVSSSVPWSTTSGLTVTPNTGNSGTSTVKVNMPTNQTSNSVTFIYGGTRVTVNIVREILANVTASAINGTATTNGQTGTVQIAIGSTATFNATGAGEFVGWTITNNGVVTTSTDQVTSVTVTGTVTAVATFLNANQIKLYCDDENTTCSVGAKTDGYWIVNVGTSYTFTNNGDGFSGFLFSSESTYRGAGSKVITQDDTLLEVFYNSVLLNLTVNNLSPLHNFTGYEIYLGGESLDFDLEPNTSEQSTISGLPEDEFTFDRMDYHYPTFSQSVFNNAGIYNVTINGNRVGWDGDIETDAASGQTTVTATVQGPITYTLTSNVQISPNSGTGATTVTAIVQGNGGTVTQKIGQFEYIWTINQVVVPAEIGWTADLLQTLEVSVAWDTTSYTDTFYRDNYDATYQSGMTVNSDDGNEVNVTATFTENPTVNDRVLTFNIYVRGSAYPLIITQAGNPDAAQKDLVIQDQNGNVMGTYDGSEKVTVVVQQPPIGTIVMWYGTAANIPTGWQICNGTNGTPNMSGAFPRGITSGTVGGTGGASSVTLAVGNLPSHNHTLTNTSISTGLATTKSFIACNTGQLNNRVMDLGGSTNYALQTGRDNGDQYGYVQNNPTNWTVSGTVGNTGSGTAFNIIPPYVNMYFIMRVS